MSKIASSPPFRVLRGAGEGSEHPNSLQALG